MSAPVMIARCAAHGLHGRRDRCFVCSGPVEQVPMVEASELARAVEERDLLLDRLVSGDWEWSSNAMVAQAIRGTAEPECWPLDRGDHERCEETYRRAPAHLQERMLPTLQRFRDHIELRSPTAAVEGEGR